MFPVRIFLNKPKAPAGAIFSFLTELLLRETSLAVETFVAKGLPVP